MRYKAQEVAEKSTVTFAIWILAAITLFIMLSRKTE
jgi:hypothetical protein